MQDAQPPAPQRPPVQEPAPSPPPPPNVWAYPAPPAESRGSGALKRMAVTLVATILLGSIVLNIYFGGLILPLLSGGMQEQVYQEGETDKRVVILPIEGMISGDTADFVRKALQQLDKDPPQALVVRIDSPGGGVTASDQIYHHLTDFKAKHEIPVVASFGATAASGGYYAGVAADHIVCEETGITGSIGVLAQHFSGQALLHKIGVEARYVVAEGSPRKAVANDVTRSWYDENGDMTDYGRESQKVILDLINSYYNRFVAVVEEGRPNLGSPEAVRAVATGDIYTAEQALANGLVDEIGYLDKAIKEAADRAQLTNPRVTTIAPPGPGLLRSLAGAAASVPDAANPGAGAVRELRRAAADAQGWSFRYACPVLAGTTD
ncbi:MAG: S49 family peptidase [Planctomycetota bacterium]